MSTGALQQRDGQASGTDRCVLDRVTPLDLSTLRIERRGLPLNVAALAILEAGALLDESGELALEAIRARIEQRLHLAPRLRQRLFWPGFGFGAPLWVDDASFDIKRHVRTHAVPAAVGEEGLLAACVELNDRPFDQAHPPWEIRLLTGGGLSRIEHPRQTLARGGTLLRQAAQFTREGRAPRTSFNRPVGRQHRVMLVRADLARAKEVAHAHRATVNDVVLCAIAGGARALLAGRGELRSELVLKVSVAASVRAPTSAPKTGNLVGVLLSPLPVGEKDPIRRLEHIARATAKRKRLPPYQPSARLLQRWMIRSINRQRRINLLMSNLPGPPQHMYFAGAKILEVFQLGVLQGNVPLQVGVLSYAGQLNCDIVADANLVPDLAVFAAGVADDLQRLGARSPRQRITGEPTCCPSKVR